MGMSRFSIILLSAMFFFTAGLRAGESLPEDDDGPEEEPVLTAEDLPTPILRAAVGDWAHYRTAAGGTTRITVVERWEQADDVLLVLEIAEKGPKRKRTTRRHETISVSESVADMRDLGVNDYVVAGEILVRGRSMPVHIVNFVEDEQVIRRSYFSDDVPVYGLVRGVEIQGNNQTTTLSLQDFGFAD